MNIVHINLFDHVGGAATIADRLVTGMAEKGHKVTVFAHRKLTKDPRVIEIPFSQSQFQQKLMVLQNEKGLFDLFSMVLLEVFAHPAFQEADVVHLHCINGGYFSYLLLPFLTAKPTIWTLHDPLAFTAGCLYADACDKWQTQKCLDCPLDENTAGKKLQRELVQSLKANVYSLVDLTLVCPSQWLKSKVEKSILSGKDTRLIYNSVDTQVFVPLDKATIRKQIGLPLDRKIVMFAAHGGFNMPLKGSKHMVAALLKLHFWYPELLLLNVGTSDSSVLDKSLPVQRIDVPYISNPVKMAELYAASDIFVSPSLSEVFGLTICEAMACGTPVVAFSTGGIPEIISHLQTGYLAQTGDVEGLVAGISYLFDNQGFRKRIGEQARMRVVDKFSSGRMIDEYNQLYHEIWSNNQQKNNQ